jgi:muramidase (phage lysozyme)
MISLNTKNSYWLDDWLWWLCHHRQGQWILLLSSLLTSILLSILINATFSPSVTDTVQELQQAELQVAAIAQSAPSSVDRVTGDTDSVSPFRQLLRRSPAVASAIVQRAFLKGAIYFAEGTYPNSEGLNPYQVIVGYNKLTSYGDHPRRSIWIPSINDYSDAAGACQFMSFTWDGLRKNYPDIWITSVKDASGQSQYINPFHPLNQDLGCLIKLIERGSYTQLVKGISIAPNGYISVQRSNFNEAVWLSCKEWASFPCRDGSSAHNQPIKAIDPIWQNFNKVLAEEQRSFGVVSTVVPPAPAVSVSPWQASAHTNQAIAGWVVTSPFGWRGDIGIPGASSFHRGVDVANPNGATIGKGVYAVGIPGSMVTVSCWWDTPRIPGQASGGRVASIIPDGFANTKVGYLHLQSCIVPDGQSTRVEAGTLIGTVGNTGNVPPHLHVQIDLGGDRISPPVGLIYWALTGKPPQ